jgi:hypothetical protein
MGMLTQEDLKQIGQVVDERLDKKLDEKLEPVLEAVREGFELLEAKMVTKDDLAGVRSEIAETRHGLMDHTDRTVTKTVGELRSELREHNAIA